MSEKKRLVLPALLAAAVLLQAGCSMGDSAASPTQGNTPAGAAASPTTATPQVAAPTFSPPGGTYDNARTLTISTTTAGAAIRYTTDGSTPTVAVGSIYSAPVSVSASETIAAIAFKAGWTDSAVSTASYTIEETVAAPSFSPAAGTYSDDQSVTISCATSGATIYYTTDGSMPTASSATYKAPIAIGGNGTTETLKAIAIENGVTTSISTAAYAISYSQVSTPNLDPQGGTFSDDQSVAIACGTSGAVIHYTTDNSAPSASSPAYTSPIPVKGNGTKTTVRAIAVKDGMSPSTAAAESYAISYPQVSTPTFSPPEGAYSLDQSLTISCATPGAEIRYTVDGSAPTGSAPTYTAPIALAGDRASKVVRAIAMKTEMTASREAAATYTIYNKWRTIGTEGEGTGHFKYPAGVALDSDGHIYVADCGNFRIVRVDQADGTGWLTFGALGKGKGQFNNPSGIAVDSSGHLYVADMSNDRIVRMNDVSGAGWTVFGSQGSGTGQFSDPAAVSVDIDGKIYVADSGNSRIVRMDDMSGDGWTAFGTRGSGTGQFTNPVGVAVDGSMHIYIADHGNYRIVRIDDMSGVNWTAFGGRDSADHSAVRPFQDPAAVAVDADGHLLIADRGNSRVLRMEDMSGTNLTARGSPGAGINQFAGPSGVALDANGTAFVVDQHNGRIVRLGVP
jgi:sugar lactone lactonase YvrE